MSENPNISASSAADRREHPRFVLLEYARIKSLEQTETSSVLVDVSLGGLQVRSRYQYEAGSTVEVTIGRGDLEPVTLNAEVRYSLPIAKSDLFATGLKFDGKDRTNNVSWAQYVNAILQTQGEALL
jgi:hypothetical protein